MEKQYLNNFGVTEISIDEMQDCSGGLSPLWRALTPIGIAVFVIENWSDVKKGITDGFNLE